MKTERQLMSIFRKAKQQGARYILSNNKYGGFDLYEVEDGGIFWRTEFKHFRLACAWVAEEESKVIFIAYIG